MRDSTYTAADNLGQYSLLARSKKEFCMARPAIVWRNPKSIRRRRLWNRARRDENSSLYIVVRCCDGGTEWEGLPNLVMIEGGLRSTRRREDKSA